MLFQRVTAAVYWCIVMVHLLHLTRVVAVAEEPRAIESESADARSVVPAPDGSIEWTGVPKIDLENPVVHKGVVFAPNGEPLAGASIYAASTIELLDMADAEDVGVEDLGAVRAVTDAEGRFQFNAEDLTWVTPAGERKRWEAMLVATKAGLPPGWLKTWGATAACASPGTRGKNVKWLCERERQRRSRGDCCWKAAPHWRMLTSD